MKTKIIISIASVIVISLTLTLVLVYYPYTPDETEYTPPTSRFTSRIIRDVPNDDYLPLLYTFENLTSQATYFEMLDNGSKSLIHNISALIENELDFLENLDPLEFMTNEWRHHNFTYVGTVFSEVNKSTFLSIYDLESLYPYFMFYWNFTTIDYYANSTLSNGYNSDDWMIPEIVDYVYEQNSSFILVTQFVDIGDTYAPLAGSGTSFERQILCLATGQPILFLSNEGPWWIS
ncbi:MAG: hypothetical protein ACTSQF_14800 [Candidatus Heimdallarchaeaceae archaeon]